MIPKDNRRSLYECLYALGTMSGCHQRPDRSFKYKGKPFPVCARCTGAFFGYVLGYILCLFVFIPIWLLLLFCLIMYIDWFLQRVKILQSNNPRRLVTGFLCGIAISQLFVRFILLVIDVITACI